MAGTAKHVAIAVPAYSWVIFLPTMRSLIGDIRILWERGDKVTIYDECGCTDLSVARASMVSAFLSGDADCLVSIDNDVGWEPGSLVKLVDHPVDMVAGVYPKRADPIEYPIRYLDEPTIPYDQDTGLLEVEAVQGGFVRYSRSCLERMVTAYSDTEYVSLRYPYGKLHGLFDYLPHGETRFGEDFAFCQRWRAIGGQVWVDPTIKMLHIGYKTFLGDYGGWLKGDRS
jgi:hypothetical protein